MCVNAIPEDAPLYAFMGEGWVEDVLALIDASPRRAVEGPKIAQGSLWVSRATGRRASVRWCSEGSVRLDFTDHAHVIMAERDLTRLYSPVQ